MNRKTGQLPGAAQAWAQVQPEDRDWLQRLARQLSSARLALVGGAVRDALLQQTPFDLDIVVEGESGTVERLAEASGLPFVFHPAFENATLTLPDGRSADLVRARRESYPHPGHNPQTQPGTLDDDLRRRDFGLNALALVLHPAGEPALLDVVGGLNDLHLRQLRPLHARSFFEDASRLVRAARLAARLGLKAAPELLAQVPDALAQAEHTPRLWAELKLLLSEPRPGHAARQLHDWGAGALLPDTKRLEQLDKEQDAGSPVAPQLYAAALLSAASQPQDLAERLALGHKPAALLERALSENFYPAGSPEQRLRELLRPQSYVPLTGKDVLALGVPAGPKVGEALQYLAALRRAGQVQSPQQERAALAAYLERQR